MATPKRSTIALHGQDCALYTWEAVSSTPQGVVVIYHGFLAHSRYATVRYAAELLSQHYCVLAADLPGHGESPGPRGYVASADDLIDDGMAVARHAAAAHCSGGNGKDGDGDPLPLFLVGSSMGGTIALAVANHLSKQRSLTHAGDAAARSLRGVMLLAPMLALDVSTPLRHVLYGIASLPLVATAALIPSSSTSAEQQYRDPAKRKECEGDPLCVDTGGKIMPASASTLVELANVTVGEHFGDVTVPFLCMVAKEDVVVKNEGSYRLMKEAASTDKKLKEYDALHGLLCEPKPLIDEIHRDLLAWITERS